MTERNAFYTLGGITIAICFATASFTLTFVNGRDWAKQYKNLQKENARLEQLVNRYHSIAKDPEVLSEALRRYETIHDHLKALEMGWRVRTSAGAMTQCFTVDVPVERRLWLAGL